MPIDPSIALQVRPIELPNPLSQYAQFAQIQNAQNQNAMAQYSLAKAQREDTQANALGKAVAESLNADGTPNWTMVQQKLAAGGQGAAIPGLQKTILEAQGKQAEISAKQAETAAKLVGVHRDQLVAVGDQPGYDAWRASMVKDFPGMDQVVPRQFTPDIKTQLLMKSDELVQRLSPKLDMVSNGQRVGIGMNPYTGQQATPGLPNQMTPDQAANVGISRANLGIKALEVDPFGTLGARGIASAAGAPIPAQAPGQQGVNIQATGADLLKTLPAPVAEQVKAYAEGRIPFPSGMALKSPQVQQMIQLVSQYDPSFDAVNYNARSSTRKDFTSGKSAVSLNALNTVLGHLDDFQKSADALNNTSIPAANAVVNWVQKQTGDPRIDKFNATKQAVVSELERAYRGGAGSEGDLARWNQSINAASSPAQLKEVISQITNLLGSKIQALGDQYSKGMGTTKDGMDLLNPKAKEAFQRLSGSGNKASGPIKFLGFEEDK